MARNRKQSWARAFQNLQPSDIINFSFISFLLAVCVLFAERVQNWHLLVFVYVVMLLTAACFIWLYRGNPRQSNAFLRRWYPLVFVAVAFFSLKEIVHHVLPYDIDSQLIAIDYAVFGTHPTVFLSGFLNPCLVDLLEICYASFYFLPVILAFLLYLKGRMSEFETFATAVCLTFYLSFVGNMLFPASGPSRTLADLHSTPLEAKWVGGFIRRLLFSLEPYPWDCFPSGHVAVTLVTIVFCHRFERKLFWMMLPVGTGLILSTVFLRYHYVVDVVAGIILAGIVVVAHGALEKAWRYRITQPSVGETSLVSHQADNEIS